MCRDECVVDRVEGYSEISIRDNRVFGDTMSQNSSATSFRSVTSSAQQFVIGPAERGHSNSEPAVRATNWKATLPNGEKIIIPDTGAFGSVTGAILARELAIEAKKHGANVSTEKLDSPFVIGGVGNGTQTCHYRLNIDLAVPETNGSATTMNWKPPIVEGTGEGLPGLLGLNSLEENRAILDVGNKKMMYPGPGEVTYNIPQGPSRCLCK